MSRRYTRRAPKKRSVGDGSIDPQEPLGRTVGKLGAV